MAELTALCGERTRGNDHARTRKPAAVDGIAQSDIAVDAGVAEIADRGDAGLENFSGELGAEKRALSGGLRSDDAKHLDVLKGQVGAVHFGEQMGMYVDE